MSILLITPANIRNMPYVKNYIRVFEEQDINYKVINWDRLNIEPTGSYTYRDKKTTLNRNIFDYLKYYKFTKRLINQIKPDKIIIFGIPLYFFLQWSLMNKKYKIILDIRDYHKLVHFCSKSIINKKMEFVVISSPGFLKWLKNINNTIVNHNTNISNVPQINIEHKQKGEKIDINYIGSLRDLDINKGFIDSLANNHKFQLYYFGDGIILEDLKHFINNNKIKNIFLHGKYSPETESNFYERADMINILLPSNDINSRTLLPNRLYQAALFGKPILTKKGTYLSNLVETKQLGLVVENFTNLEEHILRFLDRLDMSNFNSRCVEFIKEIIDSNNYYKNKIIEFAKDVE